MQDYAFDFGIQLDPFGEGVNYAFGDVQGGGLQSQEGAEDVVDAEGASLPEGHPLQILQLHQLVGEGRDHIASKHEDLNTFEILDRFGQGFELVDADIKHFQQFKLGDHVGERCKGASVDLQCQQFQLCEGRGQSDLLVGRNIQILQIEELMNIFGQGCQLVLLYVKVLESLELADVFRKFLYLVVIQFKRSDIFDIANIAEFLDLAILQIKISEMRQKDIVKIYFLNLVVEQFQFGEIFALIERRRHGYKFIFAQIKFLQPLHLLELNFNFGKLI